MIRTIWRGIFGCRQCRKKQELLEKLSKELTAATQDQIQAMRTLGSFRREYHDGTGAAVLEMKRLRKEVARLKTRIDKIPT